MDKVMIITAIKQQQKRQDRYSIYVDEKYAFSLSENDLITAGLHKGQEVTEAELTKFKQDSLIGKAYERAIRYIALRPRSQREIEDYLKRKGYDEVVSRAVITKIKKLELISDTKFAREWIESRQLLKPRSRRQLQAELRQKHISSDIIEEALSSFDDTAELNQLKDLVQRKQKIGRYQDEQKLIAYLARQGYPYGLIREALDN